jgi:imidazolonepropionase-like amidohydrolase
MNSPARTATLIVLLILFGISKLSAQTVIHAGKLINGQDGEVHNEMTIVVEDGKIKSIEDGYVDPEKFGDADSVTAIDLKEHTVMPGLMDMHTHLMMQHHKKVYSDKFFLNEADFALRSTTYAKKTLMAGFTTVRELGDNGTNSGRILSLRKMN